MDLIEWEDYSSDEFEDVFNDNRYNANKRCSSHIYEIIPEFDCDVSPEFDCCDVGEYPLCRKPFNENLIGNSGYPACFNRAFRVVEKQLIYYYW